MVEELHKPAGQPASGRVQFDHVSFDVDSEGALLDFQERLARSQVEVIPVINHKVFKSIYFTDHNGVALEATVWIVNPIGRDPEYGNTYMFQDKNPVPALKEQMEQARLLETS